MASVLFEIWRRYGVASGLSLGVGGGDRRTTHRKTFCRVSGHRWRRGAERATSDETEWLLAAPRSGFLSYLKAVVKPAGRFVIEVVSSSPYTVSLKTL